MKLVSECAALQSIPKRVYLNELSMFCNYENPSRIEFKETNPIDTGPSSLFSQSSIKLSRQQFIEMEQQSKYIKRIVRKVEDHTQAYRFSPYRQSAGQTRQLPGKASGIIRDSVTSQDSQTCPKEPQFTFVELGLAFNRPIIKYRSESQPVRVVSRKNMHITKTNSSFMQDWRKRLESLNKKFPSQQCQSRVLSFKTRESRSQQFQHKILNRSAGASAEHKQPRGYARRNQHCSDDCINHYLKINPQEKNESSNDAEIVEDNKVRKSTRYSSSKYTPSDDIGTHIKSRLRKFQRPNHIIAELFSKEKANNDRSKQISSQTRDQHDSS